MRTGALQHAATQFSHEISGGASDTAHQSTLVVALDHAPSIDAARMLARRDGTYKHKRPAAVLARSEMSDQHLRT